MRSFPSKAPGFLLETANGPKISSCPHKVSFSRRNVSLSRYTSRLLRPFSWSFSPGVPTDHRPIGQEPPPLNPAHPILCAEVWVRLAPVGELHSKYLRRPQSCCFWYIFERWRGHLSAKKNLNGLTLMMPSATIKGKRRARHISLTGVLINEHPGSCSDKHHELDFDQVSYQIWINMSLICLCGAWMRPPVRAAEPPDLVLARHLVYKRGNYLLLHR